MEEECMLIEFIHAAGLADATFRIVKEAEQEEDFRLMILFCESYTTNEDDQRILYKYNSSGYGWAFQCTEKKRWLKEVIEHRLVGVSVDDRNEKCGIEGFAPCRTIGVAIEKNQLYINSTIELLDGKHSFETLTINIRMKDVRIVGKGKKRSAIGTGSPGVTSLTLFRATSQNLTLLSLGIDENLTRISSPYVVILEGGSGRLVVKDVFITSSGGKGHETSSLVKVVQECEEKQNTTISNMNLRNVAKSGGGSLMSFEWSNVSIGDSELCIEQDDGGEGIVVKAVNSIVQIFNCRVSGRKGVEGGVNGAEGQGDGHKSCRFGVGAVGVIEGEVIVRDVLFMRNNAEDEKYGSVCWNIECEYRTMVIESVSEETGRRNEERGGEGEYVELWIQNHGRTLSGVVDWDAQDVSDGREEVVGEFVEIVHVFCRPYVLSRMRKEEGDKIRVSFAGGNLVPCAVSYEMFLLSVLGGSKKEQVIFPSFGMLSYVNENEFAIEVSKSQLELIFNTWEMQIWVRGVLSLNEDMSSWSNNKKRKVVKTESVLLLG
ncbi:uncharacterized protein MONOS_7539 [Monocercomonoides exilis]|uniref:uncharacterized protein n=1 Tax=Monocercomonoides exilis TaxID=2049356 RepID=UPI00355A3F50|nr:hypothetical protein MONOS_7539 [Monocercomonoides exilis]|eukprot:MONOS_7539.1-p1 / transcript=MONOS_7539.1 / gene=MONOS_7539 / organism=Monocercomonoides_exilis_PA203 / gene_product=unspecified product / transcript_product=unspecified product / location=Mono_scaffold00260:9757-11883(+) / protein_length=545 / sequence_SO=supercontig / SO=protein_coding / is_pseudo=false